MNKQRPAIYPFKEFSIDYPEPIIMPNGVRLYVAAGGEQEVNRLDVIHRGGSFEAAPHRLVAQFVASQLSQGTGGRSSQDIAECFDYNGAWSNGRVAYHHTTVSLNSLNRCFDKTLPVVRDMIFDPVFPQREFEVFRNRSIASFQVSRQRVKYMAGMEMARIFFNDDYPLASPVTDEEILAVNTELLKQFHRKYFHAANRMVVLSGGVSQREIDMVTEAFGQDAVTEPVSPYAEVNHRHSDCHFSFVEMNNAVQSAIQIQLPAVKRTHPDYFNLRILVTALGGYFGARLMTNLREEKGYTYGIYASLLGTLETGYVSISTECDCAYTEAIIDEVKKEIELLRNEPLSQHELELVKSNMLGDLVKNNDTPFNMANNVGGMELYGIYPQYFNDHIAAIRAVTPEALLDVARRYFIPEELYVVVAGRMK